MFVFATLSPMLLQVPAGLPSPWNWIGLAVSASIVLMVAAIVYVILFKIGYRPSHKPLPLPPSERYDALPEIGPERQLTAEAEGEA